MSFRFQRRVRIAPGLRLNLSKGGLSLAGGMRGASVNIGRRGLYTNVGLPGTGLSVRRRVNKYSGLQSQETANNENSLDIQLIVDDEGKLRFEDSSGSSLPPSVVKLVRENYPDKILEIQSKGVASINEAILQIETLHEATPAPEFVPLDVVLPLEAAPNRPQIRSVGWLSRLLGQEQRLNAKNQRLLSEHTEAMKAWEAMKSDHERAMENQSALNEAVKLGDPEAMAAIIDIQTDAIGWPEEFDAEFTIMGGDSVSVRVHAPAFDTMPERRSHLPSRGVNLSIKRLSISDRRQLYERAIFGAAFRATGISFAVLPSVVTVCTEVEVDMPDAATGTIGTQRLLHVQASRDIWKNINFANLSAVDPASALGMFPITANQTKAGELKPI